MMLGEAADYHLHPIDTNTAPNGVRHQITDTIALQLLRSYASGPP